MKEFIQQLEYNLSIITCLYFQPRYRSKNAEKIHEIIYNMATKFRNNKYRVIRYFSGILFTMSVSNTLTDYDFYMDMCSLNFLRKNIEYIKKQDYYKNEL